MQLWKKVLIGLVLGVITGYLMKTNMKPADVGLYSLYLKQAGVVFINLIMMIVAPLIFFSLVAGVNNLKDGDSLGRIGWKATIAYMGTSMFAIAMGLTVATLVDPGLGFSFEAKDAEVAKAELPEIAKILMNIIPTNAVGSFAGVSAKSNTVQVVFFAIFVGVVLNFMGKKGKNLVTFCTDAANLMFEMIAVIIKIAPIAVFGLMAWVTATTGFDAIEKLALLVACTVGAVTLHYVLLGIAFFLINGISPISFYKKSFEYQALAFSTTSSKATLATAMRVAEDKIGISKESSSFILPLGAAINMDGTAIYLGICAVFFAGVFGVDLTTMDYIMVVFTATVASIGAAGYPGGSLVMMGLVLSVIGLSPEQTALGVGFIAAVDRILDMFRTTINVTSDVAICSMIDKSEGRFDEEKYHTPIAKLRTYSKPE